MFFSGHGPAPLLAVTCPLAAACGGTCTAILKEFLDHGAPLTLAGRQARALDGGLTSLSR